MTLRPIALFFTAALLALPVAASAQGVPRGAATGARVGNEAAGPVGGAVGGVVEFPHDDVFEHCFFLF